MRRTPLRRKKPSPPAPEEEPTPPDWKAKRARMRARSEKQSRVYEVRRELVSELLARHRRCQAGLTILRHLASVEPSLAFDGGTWARVRDGLTCGGDGAPDDIHELLPRSAGGSITERSNCLAVCRTCHRWIHEHPKAARALGLLLSRYPEA